MVQKESEMSKRVVFFLTMIVVLFSCMFLSAVHKKEKESPFRIAVYMADKNLFDAHFILRVKDEINLTEKQEGKVENIVLSFRESSIRKKAEIKIKELRLASYLRSEKIDRKHIEKVIREISKKKTDCIVGYVNYLIDLKDLLTTDQLDKLRQLRETIKKKRKRTYNQKRDNKNK